MTGTVAVLGGGMVGVSAALELQSRGMNVTLIDRVAPGSETSYGNAGVIARSSLVPMNNPGLWATLPRLLTNRTASLRYHLPFLLQNMGWALGFLLRARSSVFKETVKALDALIRISEPRHHELLAQAGASDRLVNRGWLCLYRDQKGFDAAKLSRDTYKEFEIATEYLDTDALAELEPGLKRIFPKALWIKDTCSVDSPGDVVTEYARLFAARGGAVELSDLRALESSDNGWIVRSSDKVSTGFDKVVVCLGPWTKEFLSRMGIQVPMGFERGYHMHYSGIENTAANDQLTRPIYDISGGYVLSPMQQGLRLTTGVELTYHDAPKNLSQLNMAETAAREAIVLGERIDDEAWLGSRPTTPDSRPVIGAAPGRPGMWLAFGHQHIGFSTGPGTAMILADLMENKPSPIDPEPFRPGRFLN